MASEEGLVPARRLEDGLNSHSQLIFQDEALRFNSGPLHRRFGDPGRKTRELTGFIDDDRYFQSNGSELRRTMYHHTPLDRQDHQNWDGNGRASTPSGDGSDEGEDDEDEDDEVDEGDVEGLVDNNSKNNNSSNSGRTDTDKIGNGKAKKFSFVGSSGEIMMKESNTVQSGNDGSPSENHQQGRVSQYDNVVTIADPDGDLYYSQYLQGSEVSATGQKNAVVEHGCGFGGRKEGLYSSESGESLRAILSDPLTGTLMEDAMILPCGHSFGGGGIQHVIKMKACYTCSQAVSEDSVAPNLSLQAAVQAFHREEELQVYRASKRRRERFEQDKGSYGDSTLMDHPRGKGVQFPFAVTDRVIIKVSFHPKSQVVFAVLHYHLLGSLIREKMYQGNKRTPPRFVGREAVVTTQCLNGWYVVKTLDNAESVKLQYRSLAKVSDSPSSKSISSCQGFR